MKRTYESLGPGYRSKSAHCLRHTFATDLASRALGDTTLCKMVLGHKDEETTARYVRLVKGAGYFRMKIPKRFYEEVMKCRERWLETFKPARVLSSA